MRAIVEDYKVRRPPFQFWCGTGMMGRIPPQRQEYLDRLAQAKADAADRLYLLGRRAVPSVVRLLRTKDYDGREVASQTLKKFGPVALPEIVSAVADMPTEQVLCHQAADIINTYDESNRAKAVIALIDAGVSKLNCLYAADYVAHEDKRSSYQSSDLIGIGLASRLTPLLRAFSDRDEKVRQEISELLARACRHVSDPVAAQNTSTYLARALECDSDRLVRRRCASALYSLPQVSVEAAQRMQRAAKDSDVEVRTGASRALVRVGTRTENTSMSMEQTLSGLRGDTSSRVTTLEALSRMRELAVPAIPSVVAIYQSSAETMTAREVAAFAQLVSKVGKQGAAAVPLLISLLKHPDARCREQVCDALESIGPGARSALPALESVKAHDPEYRPRFCADFAIKRIEAQSPVR